MKDLDSTTDDSPSGLVETLNSELDSNLGSEIGSVSTPSAKYTGPAMKRMRSWLSRWSGDPRISHIETLPTVEDQCHILIDWNSNLRYGRSSARLSNTSHSDKGIIRRLSADLLAKNPELNREACEYAVFRLETDFGGRDSLTGELIYMDSLFIAPIQWDHVIPVAKGGPSAIGNLFPLSAESNNAKSDLSGAELYSVFRDTCQFDSLDAFTEYWEDFRSPLYEKYPGFKSFLDPDGPNLNDDKDRFTTFLGLCITYDQTVNVSTPEERFSTFISSAESPERYRSIWDSLTREKGSRSGPNFSMSTFVDTAELLEAKLRELGESLETISERDFIELFSEMKADVSDSSDSSFVKASFTWCMNRLVDSVGRTDELGDLMVMVKACDSTAPILSEPMSGESVSGEDDWRGFVKAMCSAMEDESTRKPTDQGLVFLRFTTELIDRGHLDSREMRVKHLRLGTLPKEALSSTKKRASVKRIFTEFSKQFWMHGYTDEAIDCIHSVRHLNALGTGRTQR